MLYAMRIYRYIVDGAPYYGQLDETGIFQRCVRMSRERFELKQAGREDRPEAVTPLPPVVPEKIICVGRNYADHAQELGNQLPEKPLLFFKPPSCLIAHGDEIHLPPGAERVDYEGEIALVISETCRNVAEEDALNYLLGVTAFNDVTERNWQQGDGQWARAKGCDTFGPIGPFIDTTAAEALREFGPEQTPLTLTTRLNGRTVQDGKISDLAFGFSFLISYISRYMTLSAGDVIATGTPAGVGPLKPGDEVAVELSCGVLLENRVARG
jgi:2-keto-4-pentenoate hydratase/2-oxohepta-3-ene-1,7-dioic acid hydratase in catechol pathway